MAARTLSRPARRELVDAVRTRYRISTPMAKRLILREFVAVTGYHRKSAIRILNGEAGDDDAVARWRRPRYHLSPNQLPPSRAAVSAGNFGGQPFDTRVGRQPQVPVPQLPNRRVPAPLPSGQGRGCVLSAPWSRGRRWPTGSRRRAGAASVCCASVTDQAWANPVLGSSRDLPLRGSMAGCGGALRKDQDATNDEDQQRRGCAEAAEIESAGADRLVQEIPHDCAKRPREDERSPEQHRV